MAGMYRPKQFSLFMPKATRRLRLALFPMELSVIIVEMAKDSDLPGWDPYGLWATVTRPEYDRNGDYGWLPMVDTCLPLF